MESSAAPHTVSGLRSLDAIAPLVAFLAANRLGGLRWGVAAATLATVAVGIDRRRQGRPLGRFLPILAVAVIARGVIGVVTDSEDVYFGLGIAGKIGFGLVLLASCAIARPLAAMAAPLVLEASPAVRTHQRWHRAMLAATAVGGLYYLLSGALDIVLYRRSSVEGYVVLRFIANWPLSLAALLTAAALMQRQIGRIDGAPSLTDMLDRRISSGPDQAQTSKNIGNT